MVKQIRDSAFDLENFLENIRWDIFYEESTKFREDLKKVCEAHDHDIKSGIDAIELLDEMEKGMK